jgi:hypothetical protein
LAALTDGYRLVLATYLGENNPATPVVFWQKGSESKRAGTHETLKKLDALDAQRRTVEAAIKLDVFMP